MEIHPYLTFNGNCREAFTFYETCLGGAITFIQTHGESPMAEQFPPDQRERIMHVRLEAGAAVIMGSDAPPEYYTQPGGFSVSITVEGADEAERLFSALAEGGQVQMPIGETFWAARFGMLIDRFGTPWMVNSDHPAA